jgi:hypothetical protein
MVVELAEAVRFRAEIDRAQLLIEPSFGAVGLVG